MVTTRRSAAVPANDTTTPGDNVAPTRAARGASKKGRGTPRPQTTTRRTRSKVAESPLKELDQAPPKRAKKPASVASNAADAGENEEEEGLFFTHSFDDINATPVVKAEFATCSPAAVALLEHVEQSAQSRARATQAPVAPSSPQSELPSRKRKAVDAPTPATPSFLSRSLFAIKSKLGFFSPAPKTEPAPATLTTSAAPVTSTLSTSAPSISTPSIDTPFTAPRANPFTAASTASPTPAGKRSKVRAKKQRPSSAMLRLLTRGVEAGDQARAEQWARAILPALQKDKHFVLKRTRLETPIQVKDLNSFPSSKPWEDGFGDPLGELDDDDIVPVWAVYLDIVQAEDNHKPKRRKSRHSLGMDVEDTPSLNDLFGSSIDSNHSSELHDSHGKSVSLSDIHPRRSVEPSPMFDHPTSHEEGQNIFQEQDTEAAAQLRADDRETLQETTMMAVTPKHNPAMGSYGLDYDSDTDDSTMSIETSAPDAADPVWTQAPPPAPVPAHAPLPSGSSAEPTAAPSERPVDEVERQRQKLMKHTPAKPSRLREAFVPSPSLLSDAGSESILIGSPIAADPGSEDIFADMPGAEDLGLTDEDMDNVRALQNDPAWQTWIATNMSMDADIILTYESDEEELSSEQDI